MALPVVPVQQVRRELTALLLPLEDCSGKVVVVVAAGLGVWVVLVVQADSAPEAAEAVDAVALTQQALVA